jgi:hypothetical protein
MDHFLAGEIASRTEMSRKLLIALEHDVRIQVPPLAMSVSFVLQLLAGLRALADPESLDSKGEEPGFGPDTCDVAALVGVPNESAQKWLGIAQSVSESVCKLVELASGRASESESLVLRRRVGLVAGYLYSDVKEPLMAAFPDLVPLEMSETPSSRSEHG